MRTLERRLTARNAVFLVVGNVVGAGIFTTSGLLARELSHGWVFLAAWVAGGLLSMAGALIYAELGAMFPRAGGDYQFLKEAYGSWAGFLLGWLGFWVITPGSVAALSIALVDHVTVLPDDIWLDRSLAVLIICGTTALNARGTRQAAWVQDAVTAAVIVLLLAFVVGGAVLGTGDLSHFTRPARSGASLITGAAMIAVVFTYSGWFASAYVGSEIVRPERNVPLSLLLGTGIVTVLYTAVNAAYLYALPLAEMAGSANVGQISAERLFGGSVALVVSAAIGLAILSCINAAVMTGARICWAMARDRVFFRLLGEVHPRRGTPHVALMAQALVAAALVGLGTFELLLGWVVVAMLLSSVASGAAITVLRLRRPEAERPYRAWGYPVLPALFVLAYTAIAVSVSLERPLTALAGMGIAVAGVPFYLIWKNRSAKVSSDSRNA
jgi:basic amino acid/polyamine antiporter, APA family